jgi:hypothetical protein
MRQVRRWVLLGWELQDALPYLDRWLPPSRKRLQYEDWKLKWAGYFDHPQHVISRDGRRFHRWNCDLGKT